MYNNNILLAFEAHIITPMYNNNINYCVGAGVKS